MEYYGTYTIQLATATMQMKVKDECVLFIGVAKDVINDINAENFKPLNIFAMNKKDVYLDVKVVKEAFSKENSVLIEKIHSRVNDIIKTANTNYNKWSEMKTQEDICKFKPTFEILKDSICGVCSSQSSSSQSSQPSQETLTTGALAFFGMLLFTIFGMIMTPLIIVFYILFYPLCNIYDCVSGHWNVLSSLVQKELNTGNYKFTNVIDSEVLNDIKSIVSEVNISGMDIATGLSLWPFVCKHYDTDNDYNVNHTAHMFYFQITLKPNNTNSIETNDVVIEVASTDNIDDNKVTAEGYNSIPVNEV